MDIWDTFGKEAKSQKSSEVTCFFVGSQSSGKSSLISRFLDQAGQGSNKPTIGLEYIYAKKGSVLCNIWEAGGNLDSNLVKMIQVPMKSAMRSQKVVFCLVLDLNSLNILDSICSNFLKFHENNKNVGKSEVIIVANKSDKFSSLSNDKKISVNIYLRVIAKHVNAQLIQISNTSESSMMKYKKMLSKIVFKTSTSLVNETDLNKNLVIVEDNWDSIGVKKRDIAKSDLDNFIRQERIGSSHKKRESADNKFVEPKVDSAVKEYATYTKYKNSIKT